MNSRAREFEAELLGLRPHLPGRSDREIILQALSALRQSLVGGHKGGMKGGATLARKAARGAAPAAAGAAPYDTGGDGGRTVTRAPDAPTPNCRDPGPAHN